MTSTFRAGTAEMRRYPGEVKTLFARAEKLQKKGKLSAAAEVAVSALPILLRLSAPAVSKSGLEKNWQVLEH